MSTAISRRSSLWRRLCSSSSAGLACAVAQKPRHGKAFGEEVRAAEIGSLRIQLGVVRRGQHLVGTHPPRLILPQPHVHDGLHFHERVVQRALRIIVGSGPDNRKRLRAVLGENENHRDQIAGQLLHGQPQTKPLERREPGRDMARQFLRLMPGRSSSASHARMNPSRRTIRAPPAPVPCRGR